MVFFASIGTAFAVVAASLMTVNVGIGRAWFNHTWTNNDAVLPLTIDASEAVLNRIDTIVLEVNSNVDVRANTIKVIKGIPASSPTARAMVQTYIQQYPIANILVDAGVTSIVTSKITNLVNTTACPYVTLNNIVSALFKNGSTFFPSGGTSCTVTDPFITTNTQVVVSPTGTKIGTWTVTAWPGWFGISSDATETSPVTFDWGLQNEGFSKSR